MATTTTTLGVAITTTKENYITVASATGFHKGDVVRVDSEAMDVLGIEGLVIHVMRGTHGTIAMTHTVADATVIVGDPTEYTQPVGIIVTGSNTTGTAEHLVHGAIRGIVDGVTRYIPLSDNST